MARFIRFDPWLHNRYANRVAQPIDFARFMEARSLSESLIQEEDLTEIEADNTRWDRLLATEASQNLLTKMAEEALSEHRAGKTQRMIFERLLKYL